MLSSFATKSVLPEVQFRATFNPLRSTCRPISYLLFNCPGYFNSLLPSLTQTQGIATTSTLFQRSVNLGSSITFTSKCNYSKDKAIDIMMVDDKMVQNGNSNGISTNGHSQCNKENMMNGSNSSCSNGSNGMVTDSKAHDAPISEKPLNILITMDESIVKEQMDVDKEQELLALGPGPRLNLTSNGPKSLTHWIANHSIIFKALRRKLLMIFGLERFTIYPILHEELKSKPWQETAAFLVIVIDHRKFKDEDDYLVFADKVIKEFITSVGKVLIFKLDELWEAGDYRNEGESGLRSNILKNRILNKFGKEFINGSMSKRLVKFEGDGVDTMIPSLTEAYCVTKNRSLFDDRLIKEINDNDSLPVYLKIGKSKDEEIDIHPRIPIIMNVPVDLIPYKSFNFDRYFANLESSRLGHTVIYAETTTSTVNLIDPFAEIDGMIAVAAQQTEGRGRGENQWISPKGCAMFSLVFHVPLSSRLGQRLGFVQHVISLSIVRGITKVPGYENLDLRLKWPNDIYWGRDIKVGGILVTSRLAGNTVHCFFGCGVNIDNSLPTRSLNQLIASDPKTKDLPLLTIEEVIARTLNELDFLVKETERVGVDMVKSLYLQHWLHTNQCVRMANTKKVIIKGIDDHGFLLVEDISSGLLISVQPDGNRFDMLHNLLVNK